MFLFQIRLIFRNSISEDTTPRMDEHNREVPIVKVIPTTLNSTIINHTLSDTGIWDLAILQSIFTEYFYIIPDLLDKFKEHMDNHMTKAYKMLGNIQLIALRFLTILILNKSENKSKVVNFSIILVLAFKLQIVIISFR